MTTEIEKEAKSYLLNQFKHERYSFFEKTVKEDGYDLLLKDKTKKRKIKAELKAHSGVYKSPCSIRDRLVFNSKPEKDMFESGKSIVVRVFLGSKKPKVFFVTNKLLKNAELKQDERYTIKGKADYASSVEEIT